MPSERNHPHPGDGGVSAPSATGPRGGEKPGQWSVSTRSIGEVLTTEIRCDELRLLLFAKPADETARQIESRMEDLLASNRDLAEGYSGTGAVPAPLQQAVDVLLVLVDDVERVTGRRAGAVVLYQSPREIACATIGGGQADVWMQGQPFDAPWVVLREALEEGAGVPHAQGFSLFARADLDMHLQWPYLLGTSRPAGVVVDARWHAPLGFEVTVRQMSREDQAYRDAGDDEPRDAVEAVGEEQRGDFFAGWFDDLADRSTRHAEAEPEDEFQDELEVESDYESEMEPGRGPEPELHPRVIPGASAPPPTTPSRGAPLRAVPPPAAPSRGAPLRAVPPHATPSRGTPLRAVPPPAAPPHAIPPRAAPPPAAPPHAMTGPIAFPDLIEELREHAEQVQGEGSFEAAPADGIEFEDAALTAPFNASFDATADASAEPIEGEFYVDDAAGTEEATFSPAPGRTVRRPEWPVLARRRSRSFAWRARLWWAGLIVALFAVGWWVGTRGAVRPAMPSGRAPMPIQMLRAVGLASQRFTVQVRSMPSGATITIDGKPSRYRTPAEIELPLGERQIGVTLRDLGTVTTQVQGRRGATVPLDIPLTGSLQVSAPNPATPVAIVLDGESRGFAPLKVSGITPGTHELEFTASGQPPWTQTVTVPVRGDVRIVARPFVLPSTGIIHIGATYTDDDGSADLKGATVLVDGNRRGTTPLTLELPRGPHSLRAEYRGEEAPVQVIDLPGGNERYAVFSFGIGTVFPRLVIQSPRGPVSRDVSTPVSVALQGLSARDVREMWLHVRAPDGAWRRYPMTVLAGEAGPVGVVVFPSALIDEDGDAPFYVSLLVSTGEEYFTEIGGTNPKPVPREPAKPSRGARTRVTPTPLRIPPDVHADPPEPPGSTTPP